MAGRSQQLSVRDRQPAPAEMVVADEEEYRRLPAAIEVYRAALALARGEPPGTVAARPAGA